MSDNQQLAEQLVAAWSRAFDGSALAIDWVQESRQNSPRLDNEADSLVAALRRLRNQAKRLGAAASHPVTTGFFGLSQAGKSYLISALAADQEGKLQTEFDGKRLDFVEHINPEGGGKEATGLVTRFSRSAKGGIAGYPLQLQIFSEIELVKILMNSFFNDFDKEKVDYDCNQAKVNQVLKRIASCVSSQPVAGVTADDVVDLQDYANDNFRKSVSALDASYWAKATELAPHLDIMDRATLFSILWGEQSEFTQVYCLLAQTLEKLGHPKQVFAPLSAVIKQTEMGTLNKADSIMSVDIVERLGTNRDESLQVRPYFAEDNNIGEPINVSLAQLTVLTVELLFPLINETRVSVFENVDLLDFPGYRGRLNITQITPDNPVAQLILRGKVAYLFERYTDSQEMNILVMCTPSNAQLEVNDVGPVLERWIERTQGKNAEERQVRKPGLLWAITKFDIRVQDKLSTTEENLRISWGADGLLKQTILERFGNFDWFKNWSNNQPFNNVFLVRKPGFKVPFLNVEGNRELGVNPSEQAQLDLMKRTFCQDEYIQKYVATPDSKWDAMLELNDGGMRYLSDYLQSIASPAVKLGRIQEQLTEAFTSVDHRFGDWYQAEGAEEIGKKRALAQEIITKLQKRALLLGELLRQLQLPQETIFSLYHSPDLLEENSDESMVEDSEKNVVRDFDMSLDFGAGMDLFSDVPVSVNVAEKPAKAVQLRFAKAVYQGWINHLRGVAVNDNLIRFLGLDRKTLDDLVGEIIIAADRMNLIDKLNQVVQQNEKAGYKRDQLAERQVFTMNMIIVDFLAWLGTMTQPEEQRPDSRAVPNAKIFARREVEKVNNLPKLNDGTADYTKQYLLDWFIAFLNLCENNAGHSAGNGITPAQNLRLGEILTAFKE